MFAVFIVAGMEWTSYWNSIEQFKSLLFCDIGNIILDKCKHIVGCLSMRYIDGYAEQRWY